MKKSLILLVTGVSATSLSACLGGAPRAPDEFRVVTKAPLEVPPEYNLRPPRPGTILPSEVSQDRTDQAITFGQEIGTTASAAERVLIARAGATAVSPVVRTQVDYEEAGVLRKNRRFSDQVLSYTDSGEPIPDSATGDGDVTIEQSGGPRIKLPGT